MILKNPTDSELSIKFLGIEYVLEPGGELGAGVPDDVKKYWKANIHQFLELTGDDGAEVEAVEVVGSIVAEETSPVEEETVDEATDGVVEEAAAEEPAEEVVEAPKTTRKK